MTRISINLLPLEYTQAEFKKAKFVKVQSIGLLVIMLMVFLSSLTVALRILQSQNMKQVQNQVSASEQKITTLKDRQISLFFLKNRLTAISQYLSNSSKQTILFQLLDKLIPASVAINSFSIDKTGVVVILATVPDALTLDNMVSNLIDEQTKGQLIDQIAVDNISRGRDGLYKISLKIKSK